MCVAQGPEDKLQCVYCLLVQSTSAKKWSILFFVLFNIQPQPQPQPQPCSAAGDGMMRRDESP